MKKISLLSLALAVVIVTVPTVFAQSEESWKDALQLGDVYYAQSTWLSEKVNVGSLNSSNIDKVNDILFNENDGIEYSVSVIGDVYSNSNVTDVSDMIVDNGTEVNVTIEVVSSLTSVDYENIESIKEQLNFTDEQLNNVIINKETETAIAVSSNSSNMVSTVLSAEPIASMSTYDDTTGISTGDDEVQSIALTGNSN